MEPFGEVGVLMNLGGDNSGGEILKSLLTSKNTKAEPVKVNILQGLETSNQPEEQIVFQIELGQPIKSEYLSNNENTIQQIPVTYLTSNPTFTPANNRTLLEPVTYVLSRDILADNGYCTVSDDDQKIILVQEVDPNETPLSAYVNPEAKAYAVKESQTGECSQSQSWGADHCNVENDELSVESKKRNKTEDMGAREKLAKADEESSGTKIQTERKMSSAKKQLSKRKNSKLKAKMKTGGKPLVKNNKKQVKLAEGEKAEGKEKDKRNLFELTKLEDNVDQVAERLKIGCECSDSNCFDGLNPNAVFKHRLNIADLTKAEHDMYLMGVIMASIHNLEETCRHKERIRIRSCYAYQGKKVCLTAFLYLQHVTLYQMKILRSHLKTHGVSPRIHGNRGRKPSNTFSLDIYRRASNFVQKFIEEHCSRSGPGFGTCSLSGAHDPKRKDSKTKISNKTTISYHLPPECTKRIVHGEYKSFCEKLKPNQKVMKYSTFTSFLKKQFPNVKFHKREEKKPGKAEDGWRQKEGQTELQRKSKDEGVDKSIQVDKAYRLEVPLNERRLELCKENGERQLYYRAGGQVYVGCQPYNVGQTQIPEQFYATNGTV